MATNTNTKDIYQQVTDQIVAAIEAGATTGGWRRPWHTVGARSVMRPLNAVTRTGYRGINVLCLWAAAQQKGYSSGEWATYKQWSERGAQVRKGEKSTLVVFWKFFGDKEQAVGAVPSPEDFRKARFMVRGYHVFNAAQVDGYEPKEMDVRAEPERIAAADAYFEALPGELVHGGNSAHYQPHLDRISMPPLCQFDAAVDYYSTVAHEYTHWTGHGDRLNRDLKGRFKSEAYAFEELVAELGAAYTCAQLGLESTPREDHTLYIAHWLQVLKKDKYAIFTAARLAQAAVDYLNGLAGFEASADEEAEPVSQAA